MKFTPATPFEAFRNIGHDGDGRSLNLSRKPKVRSKRASPTDLIDQLSKLSSLLPRNQVLKSLYFFGHSVLSPHDSVL